MKLFVLGKLRQNVECAQHVTNDRKLSTNSPLSGTPMSYPILFSKAVTSDEAFSENTVDFTSLGNLM